MRYFQEFPSINYKTTEIVDGIPQQLIRVVPNMTVRFNVSYQLGDYEWYQIQEQDRPDTLAAQWYGSSSYAWVILLSNGMRDMYDWPMNSLQFYDYMNRKYESSPGLRDGVEQSSSTVYQFLWKDPISNQEIVVDETFNGTKRTLYVYDHEAQLNARRYDIKRLTQSTFASFVRQFSELVGSF